MSLSIRARLTLWYSVVLSLVLAISAAASYVYYAHSRIAQVDEALLRADGLVAHLLPPELDETADLARAAQGAFEDIEIPGLSVAILDAAGVPVHGRWEDLPSGGVDALGKRGNESLTVRTPAGPFRVYRARHQYKGITFLVGAAQALTGVERELSGLRGALVASVLFALLLAVAGAFWIAHGALRPVALMAAQARQITDRTPGFRLAAPNPQDELGLLASAFNGLLARLEAALAQQRQFMADASHELRTPVSIARTTIEVTLGRAARPEEEYRESLGVVREQMRRLTRIVEDLFTLARADAAGLPLERRPLYLDEMVGGCVKETRVLADAKGVELAWRAPGEIEVSGDERWLQQMLTNLLDNAIRHTPAGKAVSVELGGRDGVIELTVRDSGPGIPEPERERVFERFVRLDPSRHGEGSGLGLPIARTIAEAHGGTLVLAQSDPSGSTFLVRLPRGERPAS